MNNPSVKVEEEHETGGGFTAGLMMGMVFGGIAAYMLGSPNGKKNFKEAVARGQEILEELEERIGPVEIVHEVQEAYKDSDSPGSFVANLKKRVFKKNGKKLTS
jgi:hypothetical protein